MIGESRHAPIRIKNLSFDELAGELASIGLERYRCAQIFAWLYKKGVADWGEMTDVGKSSRATLAGRFEIGILKPAKIRISSDGTRKYLFELEDGLRIESVFIPEGKRRTLCVSSQVGCALGCGFCYTGTLGFKRNLETWEIVEQALAVRRDLPESDHPTNVVFMGMGEPLLNYDNVLRAVRTMTSDEGLNFGARRITLSTAGVPAAIDKLARDKAPVLLALSLNAPRDDLRSRVMPANKRYPLADVVAALEKYPLAQRRRFTFEYVMLKGVNDDALCARQVANLLKRFPCKINLIPFNPFPGCEFEPSDPDAIERFAEILRERHLSVFLRKSRGADVLAACGQLAGEP